MEIKPKPWALGLVALALFLSLIALTLGVFEPPPGLPVGTSPAQAARQPAGAAISPNLAAFSPDGGTLATADAGRGIVLWDVLSGQTRRVIPDHFGTGIGCLAFGPEGGTLAIAGAAGVELLNVAGGLARTLLANPAKAASAELAFSGDGALLAARDPTGGIGLWEIHSGVLRQYWPGTPGITVNGLALSHDGKYLAVADSRPQLKVWDLAPGQPQPAFPAMDGLPVRHLVFSPGDGWLAILGQDGGLGLLDPATGQTLRLDAPGPGGTTAPAFSPDGGTLAGAQADGSLILWDRISKQARLTLPGEAGAIPGNLRFSPDGGLLAAALPDHRVRLWDTRSGAVVHDLAGSNAVAALAFLEGQAALAAFDQGGQVRVWDLATGGERLAFQVPAADATAIAERQTAPAGSETKPTPTAPAISPAQSVQATSPHRGKSLARDWKGIMALAASSDGRSYATAGADGYLRLWDGDFRQTFAGKDHHGAAIPAVAFSGDGAQIVSAGRDTEIHVHAAANGQLTRTLLGLEFPPRAVAVAPDQSLIAAAGEGTNIMLWEGKSGKLTGILSGHRDFVNDLAFNGDGQLASAGADGEIVLWNTATGKPVHSLRGHNAEVNALSFGPDGKRLASVDGNGQVILWDVETGQALRTLAGHTAAVRAVRFGRNGKYLFSADAAGQVLVWKAESGQLAKRLGPATGAVNALAVTPDGQVVAAGEDGRITAWDPETGRRMKSSALASPPAWRAGPSDIPAASLRSWVFGLLTRGAGWLLPAAEAAGFPHLDAGPGGPILVVIPKPLAGTPVAYEKFLAEILRNEGFNEFAVLDIAAVTAQKLQGYDLAILAPMALSAGQAQMLGGWVNGGGKLIALRPARQLASLLGIQFTGATLVEGYLRIDTSRRPGNGIAAQSMQFHGSADRYTLTGATALAQLYSNPSTRTANPAVTLKAVGAGQAAAFAFDLARSVVYLRQGNPAWSGMERDGLPPIRSDDLYFGQAQGDPKPDWVDLANALAIPQADEQQRFLANLLIWMNSAKKPLPRFWYLPRGDKAAILMTGDDHGNGGTPGRFDQFISLSPPGCSVDNWECVRGTSYIYTSTPLDNAKAASYDAAGFEIALHASTDCADWTPASLDGDFSAQIGGFRAKYTRLPAPRTMRIHCIAWSDWSDAALTELKYGIRLDTNYYFWPPAWVKNRPGVFTGSAMPMRFADTRGNIIDVYQAASQMTDESGQSYPNTANALLNRALGAEAYYGVYTINAHTDVAVEDPSTLTVASARSRRVPIVSGAQMLKWLDGRNGSSFGNLTWDGASLGFNVDQAAGANGLQAMIPVHAGANRLLRINGAAGGTIMYTVKSVKGIEYAAFPAATGGYKATYAPDTARPTVGSISPANAATDVAPSATVNAGFSEAMEPATLNAGTFTLTGPGNAAVAATLSYVASSKTAMLKPVAKLAFATAYTATVKGGQGGAADLAGNTLAANRVWSFRTRAGP